MIRVCSWTRALTVAGIAALNSSCVPKATVLPGVTVAPARLPSGILARARQTIAFTWSYEDADMRAAGEGAARIASPDSARLDFFLAGGLGGGQAVVIGDSLFILSNAGLVKRFLPPVSMFWATLGRLAVPAGDTTVRVDGHATRADIARGGDVMRVTFDGERLASLEHLANGGIEERLTRGATRMDYENLGARRHLTLVIVRTTDAASFDDAIWRH